MRERMACLLIVLAAVTGILTGCSKEKAEKATVAPIAPTPGSPETVPDGEALFKQYCAACHPNGGNVSDPDRPLYGSVLKARHIRTPEDIVRIMRRPLSRMIRFDVSTLSDKDAHAIAMYVLKTFK
ncbi:MAG: c-type cytochrome [Desulfuromonadales bacterium]|nr:c-type cytochrome [Desulfuromonadales bacterium]